MFEFLELTQNSRATYFPSNKEACDWGFHIWSTVQMLVASFSKTNQHGVIPQNTFSLPYRNHLQFHMQEHLKRMSYTCNRSNIYE